MKEIESIALKGGDKKAAKQEATAATAKKEAEVRVKEAQEAAAVLVPLGTDAMHVQEGRLQRHHLRCVASFWARK